MAKRSITIQGTATQFDSAPKVPFRPKLPGLRPDFDQSDDITVGRYCAVFVPVTVKTDDVEAW